MRLLFVKEALAWPRSSGHDVHCFHMMRALAAQGHALALAMCQPAAPDAVRGLTLEMIACLDGGPGDDGPPLLLDGLRERFRSYWGIEPSRIREVGRLAGAWGADAVVVVGLNVLPYLGAVRNALRVWYAADEWAWHHLSQVRLTRPGTWGHVKQALVKGLYERAYASVLDRVWVVSETDRRAMAWVAGTDRLDVAPNGVDAAHFAPRPIEEEPETCVFWGRLDFGPNVQALEWFCRRVWPGLRAHSPTAGFTIYGFQPTPAVEALAGRDGIALVPDLPDLREEVARHAVVVLPFVSGGGIKNKLLEAASLGKAVVCTPRTCSGLSLGGSGPLRVASRPAEWVAAVTELWAAPAGRRRLGLAARQWVERCHTWEAAAVTAAAGLEKALQARRPA
jgi:glycosyltransferase involved in cell wall biosynthesis